MKTKIVILTLMLAMASIGNLPAQDEKEIVFVFEGSNIVYDDDLGFNVFDICVGKQSDDTAKIKRVEGYVRHRFCIAPANTSAYEIVKNYEEAVKLKDGIVYYIVQKKECISTFMKKGHPGHGMTNYEYMQLPNYAGEYFSGKIHGDEHEYYIAIALANVGGKTVYSLITIQVKAMETGKVTIGNLEEGSVEKGQFDIYNIFFDTDKYEVKKESNEALKVIAEYMNSNPDKKFYIVGHTDNVGKAGNNQALSLERAKAVRDYLVGKGIDSKRINPVGYGQSKPKVSNDTEAGRLANRRVEFRLY